MTVGGVKHQKNSTSRPQPALDAKSLTMAIMPEFLIDNDNDKYGSGEGESSEDNLSKDDKVVRDRARKATNQCQYYLRYTFVPVFPGPSATFHPLCIGINKNNRRRHV